MIISGSLKNGIFAYPTYCISTYREYSRTTYRNYGKCPCLLQLLDMHHFKQSMSGKGNCYDNAVVESFFHTLKTEEVYFEKYDIREIARQKLFEYIEIYYNRK